MCSRTKEYVSSKHKQNNKMNLVLHLAKKGGGGEGGGVEGVERRECWHHWLAGGSPAPASGDKFVLMQPTRRVIASLKTGQVGPPRAT